MEEQSRKVVDRAVEVYHREMNSKLANVHTSNVKTLKEKQKQLEEELREMVVKELKNYAHVAEVADKFIVLLGLHVQ